MKKKNKIRNLLVYLTTAFVVCFLIIGFLFLLWIKSLPIPDFETFNERKIIQSTKIYDRTGKNLLYDVFKDVKRTVIPYEEIPLHIKNATVIIEDENFYQHNGISIEGILRAFTTNLKHGKIKGQGGSTITQQLVKNSFLTPEKTFTRKIKEAIIALKIERVFSKEKILTLYLNEIPYGGTNYGIESASQSFFNKQAKNLTLAESAYLAAIPQRPTYYSPYGSHIDELEERKTFILEKMLQLGFISENEYNNAISEEVVFSSIQEKGIEAPHFVMYIKSYLEEMYGADFVEYGGLKVTTTLDLELQKEAEKLALEYSKTNEKNFNAKNTGIVGVDPKTGQIIIMVGSRNYFDEEYEGKYNIALAERQPGSAFKPFVYATAFKKGYTPETVVFDLKTEFNSSCNPDSTPKFGTEEDECYSPGNYDNIFRGPVSLRNALAQSINVPAVKTLYLAGLNDSLNTAKDMGISTLTDPLRYGLTLVLGGGEVSLLDITSAYSVFANDGIKNKTVGILKITDNEGNIIKNFEPQPTRVLDPNVSSMINDVLSDNVARTPAFGARSWLYFSDRDVAAKTGTTNDYRDAWVVGYTPNFSLGVWVGNNDNTSMEKRVAGFITAPLWNAVFNKVFESLPKEDFKKNEQNNIHKNIKPVLRGYYMGSKTNLVDTDNGQITENIPTQIHSILYWVDKNDPNGEIPTNPEKDSQFYLWEKPVRDWLATQNIIEEYQN